MRERIAIQQPSGRGGQRKTVAISDDLVEVVQGDGWLFTINPIHIRTKVGPRCQCKIGRFVGVVPKAPSACCQATQAGQARAACHAASHQTDPSPGSHAQRGRSRDQQVAPGGSSWGGALTRIEQHGTAGRAGGVDVASQGEVARQGRDTDGAGGSNARGGTHCADGERIAVNVG